MTIATRAAHAARIAPAIITAGAAHKATTNGTRTFIKHFISTLRSHGCAHSGGAGRVGGYVTPAHVRRSAVALVSKDETATVVPKAALPRAYLDYLC
jgi:hypothetical protein